MRQIATFILGETAFGVDVLLVKEVYREMALTPVPGAPEQIRGLMNLRGKVVTVVDLDVCLNRESRDITEDNRLLIFKTDTEIAKYQSNGLLGNAKLGEDIVGLLIDTMQDVLEINDDEILAPPPNLDDVERDLIEGVIKKGEQLIILLDVTEVLQRIVNLAVSTKDEESA